MTGDQIRLLLVDDHEMFTELIERELEGNPAIAVVGTARRLSEVPDAVRTHAPDVVLMDYRLPDGEGTQGIALVKELRAEAQVVMLTGFADEDVMVEAIELGCSGFLTKNQPIDELVPAIKAAADGEALVDPTLLSRLLPRLRQLEQVPERPILTPREGEILQFLADGTSTAGIAEQLVLSPHTVRNHIQNILTKVGAHSKLEAVAVAARMGILPKR